MDFIKTKTNYTKYPFRLSFSPRVERILKKYCHYSRVTFLFKYESEIDNAIEKIKEEIKLKYPKGITFNEHK